LLFFIPVFAKTLRGFVYAVDQRGSDIVHCSASSCFFFGHFFLRAFLEGHYFGLRAHYLTGDAIELNIDHNGPMTQLVLA